MIAIDIETLKGFFCAVVYDYRTKEIKVYENSTRKNENKELIKVLKNAGKVITFNGVNFDDLVLHYIIKNPTCDYKQIYNVAQLAIEGNWDNEEYKQQEKDGMRYSDQTEEK